MASAQKYTPKQVLDAFYDAEREFTSAAEDQRDFRSIAATIADDFYMEQTSGLPWAGVYHGSEGMKDWMTKAASWVVIDVRDPEIFERQGSDRIVVLSTIVYRVLKTGQTLEFPLSQTFVVDCEKGLIKEIRSYYWDVHMLNKILGYEPKA